MDQPKQGNWWSRNWKWFVPVGCLGMIVLFIGFIAIILFSVFGFMKSSDAYKIAVEESKSHPAIIEVLGTPIEEGLFVSGNINISGSSGNADIAIPISGPNGEATIYAVAAKSAGKWTFSILEAEIKGTGERLNLLE